MEKTIIYTCPFVPAEWISAHGLRPSRLLLDSTLSGCAIEAREGLCSFAGAFIRNALAYRKPSAVIVTTLCDQMRRAFDILVMESNLPVFLFNVPKTWRSPSAHKLYIDELKRLGSFLVDLGGKSPSNSELAKVMLEYDNNRKSLLEMADFLPSRQFSETIAEFNQYGKCRPQLNSREKILSQGIPLAIIGGPLFKGDFSVFDFFEESGGRIVLDATETGLRGLCHSFDRRALHDNPLIELAAAYFGSIPDPSQRPNTRLYDWLIDILSKRSVRGIILKRNIWCDIWHAELFQLKQIFNLPVLDIDVDFDGQKMPAQALSRIKAFMEILR
jgi:benzoyl-CoA reductase/2-hydroxyglutaryl-CoA dehydratase subunit BcrC/BadD/HgdB